MQLTERDRPLVSVLIPAYNAGGFLAECLGSATAQTYPEIEVIVVDDGSTDDTLAIARRFESSRLKVISQANAGQPAALNAAAKVAQGSYIQYLDADDLLHPTKIERQIDRLKEERPGLIATGPWTRFVKSADEASFVAEPIWTDLDAITWHVSSWSGGGMMHVAAWLLPRDVVDAAGQWAPELRWAANVDADFFTRALLASAGTVFVADARSYYRSVPHSQSSLRDPRSVVATLEVLMRTGEALLSAEDSQRTRQAFADNLQRFIYGIYPDSPQLVKAAESNAKRLGSSNLRFSEGPTTVLLSRFVGWKSAKRLRRVAGRLSGS